MPVAGIDIGSLSTEVVILKKEMLAQVIIPTGANSKLAAEAMKEALEKSGLSFNELRYIVATGYGRVSVPFANKRLRDKLPW